MHPAREGRRFCWRMEDVLDVYARPTRSARGLLGRASRQYSPSSPRPARWPRAIRRGQDYEYQRGRQRHLFLVRRAPGWLALGHGQRQRTGIEWARGMRALVDDHFPAAERIVLVRTTSTPTRPRRGMRRSRRPRPGGWQIGGVSLQLLVYRRRWLEPAPLWWPLPAQRPPDDRRLLLLAEFALGRPAPRQHWQHAWLGGWPGWVGGIGWWRWEGSGVVGVGRRASVMRLQRRQGALQGLDRVGPLGGQVLGGSAAGALKLQVVLEFSNPVITRLASRSATPGLVLLFLVGSAGLAWSQPGRNQVLGRDAPEPALTGDGAWLPVGSWEAPGRQIAADRRDRDSAPTSRLGDRQARPWPQVMLRAGMLAERLLLGVITALPAIRNWFPGAHDRSLSRSVRSVLTDLSAVEQLSRWRSLPHRPMPFSDSRRRERHLDWSERHTPVNPAGRLLRLLG